YPPGLGTYPPGRIDLSPRPPSGSRKHPRFGTSRFGTDSRPSGGSSSPAPRRRHGYPRRVFASRPSSNVGRAQGAPAFRDLPVRGGFASERWLELAGTSPSAWVPPSPLREASILDRLPEPGSTRVSGPPVSERIRVRVVARARRHLAVGMAPPGMGPPVAPSG